MRRANRYGRHLGPIAILLLVCSNVAFSQSSPWEPPPPSATEKDWIRMSSGEWIKGELNFLIDDNLEFDSEDLDLLELDWADVAELRSPRIMTYRFEDIGVFSGTATMRDSIVTIRLGNQSQTFPREALLGILEGRQREIDYWSAKATLGFVARAGNTEQQDVNTMLYVRRRAPKTRLDLRYSANAGKVGGEETVNNQNGMIGFDLFVSKGFYVSLFGLDIFKDRFQNVQLRSTLSGGLGYEIFHGKLDWGVGLSAGYQSTQFVSVAEGEADSEETGTAIPNTDVEWEVTGDVTISGGYKAQISLPDVEKTYHHAFAALEVEIWGDFLDLNLSITWDRNESPTTSAEGETPKRDDFRTAFSFGITL